MDVEKSEASCIAGRYAEWYRHFGKQFGNPSELNTELPHDSAILFLGIYSREMNSCSYKNLYMNAHSTLFIIVKK